MHGKIDVDGVEPASTGEAAEGRTIALSLMSKALAHLDDDDSIPKIIAAQLQMAIDALWISSSTSQASIHLH